jgi:hypothetical protein
VCEGREVVDPHRPLFVPPPEKRHNPEKHEARQQPRSLLWRHLVVITATIASVNVILLTTPEVTVAHAPLAATSFSAAAVAPTAVVGE